MEDVELNPPRSRTGPIGMAPWGNITSPNEGNETDVAEEEADTISNTGTQGDGSHTSPEAIPVQGLPSLSAQVSPSPRPLMQHPAPEYALDGSCEPPQAPAVDRTK